jgi:hypothetical protein
MYLSMILIISPILDFIGSNLLSLFGGVGAIIMAVTAWFTKKYLIPYLKMESRRRYARWIAIIADELTDDLRARYPHQTLLKYADEAVDRIIQICEIDIEIARRAVSAAIARK